MSDRLTAGGIAGRTLVIATGHDLSLALLDGTRVEAELATPMARGHAEALVPAIAALLKPFGGADARCDTVVVETGPGSFTGLRVGLAAASALALAWGAALKGIRSTQLVAADARRAGQGGKLLVALAAPRGQVWVEGFAAGGLQSLGFPEALDPAASRELAGQFDAAAGTADFVCEQGVPCISPRAAAIGGLALKDLGEAELLYVRSADSSGP